MRAINPEKTQHTAMEQALNAPDVCLRGNGIDNDAMLSCEMSLVSMYRRHIRELERHLCYSNGSSLTSWEMMHS